jgi:hypothetical protein
LKREDGIEVFDSLDLEERKEDDERRRWKGKGEAV